MAGVSLNPTHSLPQLPIDVLHRIKNYALQAAEKEITPEKYCTPLTEGQILLRKIGREVFNATFDPGVIHGTFTVTTTDSPAVLSMSQSEIDNFNRESVVAHARRMAHLQSILKQIERMQVDTELDSFLSSDKQ